MDTQEVCSTKGCGQPAVKRGKCRACYQLLNRLRKKLGVDWDVFERAGHCGPRKRRVAATYADQVAKDVAALIEKEKQEKERRRRRQQREAIGLK